MPLKIGLATSFVVGLLDDKDIWHVSALELQAAFQTREGQLYIFDCVLSEVISTLARRTHEKRRQAELTTLLDQLKTQFPANSITWLTPTCRVCTRRLLGWCSCLWAS